QTEIEKLPKKRARLKKKLRCRFCPNGCDKSRRPVRVDYKDLKTLRTMIDRAGSLLSRRTTGSCAAYQRAVREASRRARSVGLLPYVAEDEADAAVAARRRQTSPAELSAVPRGFVVL